MPTLELSDQECSELMNRLIATDPLLMKIGEQLRRQQQHPVNDPGKDPTIGMTTERAWAADGKGGLS